MALIETLNQLREAYEAIAGVRTEVTETAAQMRQQEQRVAALVDRAEALVDQLERAAATAWWERLFVAGVAGLVAALVVFVAFRLL